MKTVRLSAPAYPSAPRDALRDECQLLSGPSCPLCSNHRTARAFKDNGYQLYACDICDLFFAFPYPTPEQRRGEVASGQSAAITLLDCKRRYEGECRYYERHFSTIEKECQGGRSILDVGCGTGRLLELLQTDPNLFRLGIELNSQAAAFARKVCGCPILETPFEEFRYGKRFDVVLMINVLSHFSSFDDLFLSLENALAPGGRVIIRTSEMSRSVRRWNQIHWGVPDDLQFLGLRTLDVLCARYGFKIMTRIRTPFEDELFLRSRWQQMGRKPWQNLTKQAVSRIPGALAVLKIPYRALLGDRFFVSFIVLERDERSSDNNVRARAAS